MALKETLASIEDNLEAEQKFKAVTRLRSLIKTYPHDLSLRHQLAVIYDEAGFQDAAGLYWLLCEPNTEHMQKAVAIYRASVNHSSQQILADLAFHGEISELDEYAQSVLQALYTETGEQPAVKSEKSGNPREFAWGEQGCLIVVVVLVLLFALDVVNGVISLFSWLL